MNGVIRTRLAAACLVGGLALTGGCEHYRNVVDPCWPERYTYQSRSTVRETFATQANNGHVLDQTVWAYLFEPGSDKLTPAGLNHLAYLARRRPAPDPTIYLQTAPDVGYDAAAPSKMAEARAALDTRRSQAIRNYLGAQTAGRGLDFQVVVHDPYEAGMAADHPTQLAAGGSMRRSIILKNGTYAGGLPVIGGSNVSGAGR